MLNYKAMMARDPRFSTRREALRAAVGLAAACALGTGVARADEPGPDIPDALTTGSPGRVVEIVDGDTLLLADDREVRLVGLQAPKLPLGRAGFEAWPLSDEAKATLGELTLDRVVTLAYGGRRVDRYERKLAHLFRDDGLWIQAEMLRRGMARVYSFADNRTLVRRMQRIEATARNADRGIWSHPFYRVRTVAEAHDLVGGFQLVMGRVRATADVRGRIFLNFGEDWREDFTVMIPPERTDAFDDAAFEPLDLEGRWVRVRGWIESYNGPMIEATHPEQIEVIP